MKKASAILMSALTMIIALTAWANADKLGSPRGVGENPTLLKVTPEAGSTVTVFERVTMEFDQEIQYVGQTECPIENYGYQTVGYMNVAVDENDPTVLVMTCDPITVDDKYYVLDFDLSDVRSKDGNGQCNDFTGLMWVVKGEGGDKPVEPSGPLAMTMASNSLDGKVYTDDFDNFTIDFQENTIEATVNTIPLKNETTGTVYDLEINARFMTMFGVNQILLMAGDLRNVEAGEYTLTIPAGAFKSTASGAENEALSVHYTLKKSTSTIDPDLHIEVTSMKYYQFIEVDELSGQNRYEAPVELVGNDNAVIPSIFPNDKFEIATNVNDACGVLYFSFYEGEVQKDPATGYDLNAPKRSTYTKNKNASGNFEVVMAGSGLDLESGKDYTVAVYGIDREDVAPNMRNYFGLEVKNGNVINPITLKVKGNAKPFEYSDVTLVEIDPPLTKEIVDENQQYFVTFSAPVTIPGVDDKGDILSGQNTGMGTSMAFRKLEKVDVEGTVWMFQPYASQVKDATASIDFFLKVLDAEGRVVRPEGSDPALKDKTRFQFQYKCHIGSPLVTITPAPGTVEKIFSFEATASGGAVINMGSALDKPYLTTPSGARVADVDMSSVVAYDKAGKPLSESAEKEPKSVKITFNLDKEITGAGKYLLHCPFAAFSIGEQFEGGSSRTWDYAYIIEGTPEISGSTIQDGAELSELSLVGFYTANEVAPASEGRTVKMQLRDEESTIGNYDLIYTSSNGYTLVMADFNTDGKPLALEPGVNYTLRVSEGALVISGTDMAYPEFKLNVKGASAGAEFVKLSHSVADHAAVVSEVAKGKEAVVNLTPAAGWKVEKVTLDNKDVTNDVKDNVYTTPALVADAALNVTMAYDGIVFTPAGADDVVSDFNLRAWSEGGQIFVAGLELGMKLDVFTVGGALAGSYVADDTAVACKVAQGVYVVVVTDKAGKTQAIKIQNK